VHIQGAGPTYPQGIAAHPRRQPRMTPPTWAVDPGDPEGREREQINGEAGTVADGMNSENRGN